MSRSLVAACLLLFAATLSVAQDNRQTPENAQKFFARVVEQGGVRWAVMGDGGGWNTFMGVEQRHRMGSTTLDSYDFKKSFDLYDVTGINPDKSVCGTVVHTNTLPDYSDDARQKNKRWIYQDVSPPWGPFVIDWTKISSVTAEGELVVLGGKVTTHSKSFPKAYLRVGSADMAKRVAFAMEFLRVECDKTGGLGF